MTPKKPDDKLVNLLAGYFDHDTFNNETYMLAWLWKNGYKVVPLEPDDEK